MTMNTDLTPENVLKIIKIYPDTYRNELNRIYLMDKTGNERTSTYTKLNNIIFGLRRKGLAPPTGTGLKKNRAIKFKALDLAHHREDSDKYVNKSFSIPTSKILLYLMKTAKPESYSEISNGTKLTHSTIQNTLSRLKSDGLIQRNKDKNWTLTNIGYSEAKKLMPFQELYQVSPEDNFFYHIPMLIEKPGEEFNAEDIAQRAYGYQGFYEKYGMAEEEALEEFRKKIRAHLENETLNSTFIQQERHYQYKALNDEDHFLLWRLYSMLHTTLFKSNKNRKLGLAVWLYDPLLKLLRNFWGDIETRLSSLSKDEQWIIILMLNGVSLETILPKSKVMDFREKLLLHEIPFTVYDEGTDNETTIVETKHKT